MVAEVTVLEPDATSVKISVICPPLKTRSAVKSPSVNPVVTVVIFLYYMPHLSLAVRQEIEA